LRGTTEPGPDDASGVDVDGLAAELRRRIRGEVRFGDGDRALYATDGSNYRQVPIGVVIPTDIDDVVETVAACREFGAPVLSRGGGTSLAGQCCNVAVVIDFSKHLNRILELDPDRRTARVQPGVVLDVLRDRAERHHLTFAPDPSTHAYCTLGGMVGNNSCGVHSVMAGKVEENVEQLEILTYDGLRMRVGSTSDDELEEIVAGGGRGGEIYSSMRDLRDRYSNLVRQRYPNIPRRVSGYNLNQLLPESGFHLARALVGTEGTCVSVLEATVRLVHSPPARSLLLLGYPDVYGAADDAMEVLEHGPIGLEGIDDVLIGNMKKKGLHPEDVPLLPEGKGWLMVEFGGESSEEADALAEGLMKKLGKRRVAVPSMKLFDDPGEEHRIWEIRESALGATARVPGQPDTWEGWEDSAVPPERLGAYLRELRKLYEQHGYIGALYGHFGQGCVHTRINFDLVTEEGIRRFRSFLEEASDLVLAHGGSLSGEHGDGQSRAELLPKMFGPELVRAFGEFKAIWDPGAKMNPGKVVDPHPITENLRLGTHYAPPQPRTHFAYPNDEGSLARAVVRCVGVGKCRRLGGGTMCPSYMVTREEKHSTRGRAHLLFEMMQGDPLEKDWRSEAVLEALDLCLSCKGCKRECPVNVDMATYKAEFLSHHYKGRLRPRAAYSMGLIHWWARAASHAPRLANMATHAPVVSNLLKRMGGIAPQREAPVFTEETFRKWFERRRGSRRAGEGRRVILWPDTFTNYFHPRVGKAAVMVLEAAGYRVTIPAKVLCCGRPLYDYGMLDTAKRLLRQILRSMREDIASGVPLIGLEPSCAAVFRDELKELLPQDLDAQRLSRQTFLLSEFLQRDGWEPPKLLPRKAIVQGHCHHKAVMGFDAERRLLERLGLDLEVLDSGCCGMAGSFGFEKGDKYEVSVKAGERVLLPRAREAEPDTLILADGFSCRTQIQQGTGRRAVHLAEVIAATLR
jgi:FAD/FMN-containing dehydrogenase/Fe-S oxidoreductase